MGYILALAGSFGFTVSVPLGLALVAGALGCVWMRIREHMKIADALSEHFGTVITWGKLPRFRPDTFKRACATYGWRSDGLQEPEPAAEADSDSAAELGREAGRRRSAE